MNNRLLVRGVWLADIVAAGLLLIIAACDGKGQSADTSPSATSQATSPPTMQTPTIQLSPADATATALMFRGRILGYPGIPPSPADPTEQAWQDQVVSNYYVRMTAIALTPHPTRTPGAPPDNPEPTPILGVSHFCDAPSKLYGFTTCWRGTLDNQWYSVGVGSIINEHHPRDPERGVVVVYEGKNLVFYDGSPDVYPLPEGTRLVRIRSAAGTQLTIVEAVPAHPNQELPNGRVFVFDIATRQFITP